MSQNFFAPVPLDACSHPWVPAPELVIPPGAFGPYSWTVGLYDPPPTPADVKLWSEVQLHSVVAVWPVARAILPKANRTGRLCRSGPFVVALNDSSVPGLGIELQRGEWVRLDNGARGRDLLELYCHVNWRPYKEAVTAIGARAGLVGSDGAIRRLSNTRQWSQELNPLHADGSGFVLDARYPPTSMMLPYLNAFGHAVAQVVRVRPRGGTPIDLYRSLWRHNRTADTQWIEAYPRPPYPLFNESQIFRCHDAEILLLKDEFVAHELGGHVSGRVCSAVPGGLGNLPQADLTSLRARRVGVLLRREDIPQGRRIEAALLRAGVAEPFFLLSKEGSANPFSELETVATTNGLDLLPVVEGEPPPLKNVVIFEAGDSISGSVERPVIINPIVKAGDLVWIYGEPKTGKTWLALVLAHLARIGKGVVGPWTAVKPAGVLLVDGEMHAADLSQNIQKVINGAGHVLDSDHVSFAVLSAKAQSEGIIDLADPDWQDQIDSLLVGRTIVIFDNFQALTDNGPGALKAIHPWLCRLTRAGIAVLVMDHTNREGDLQGTVMKERIADLSISLRYRDYEDRMAGIIEVDFTVARCLYGADVQPFRMQRIFAPDSFAFRLLDPEPTSGPELSLKVAARVQRMAVVAVAREQGMPFAAIQDKYGIPVSSAHGVRKVALKLKGLAKSHYEAECIRLRGARSSQA